MNHVLTLLVENKPTVLARIANQLGRRNVNIEYLALRLVKDGLWAVIVVGFKADELGAERIARALHKLVNVLEVTRRVGNRSESELEHDLLTSALRPRPQSHPAG